MNRMKNYKMVRYLCGTRTVTSGSLLAVINAGLLGCYCPNGNCDYAFRPNYDARHRVFVQGLEASVGRPFNHTCLRESNCPSQSLDSGLTRYTLVDWRP